MQEELNIPHDFDDMEKYAPALAKIAKQQPFDVPPGYFEANEQFIQAHAHLLSLKKDRGFTVPENYFEELTGIISDRIFLQGISRDDVPEGYFDELPNIIRGKIFLRSLDKQNAFTIPENYFEELQGNVASRISLESLKKQDAFEVPGGYFDALTGKIGERVQEEKKAPVIIRLFRENVRYIAAAASVALIVGLAFYLQRGNTTVNENLNGNALAMHVNVPTHDDIKRYILENVSEGAILEYAEANNIVPKKEVAVEKIEKKDVENYLLENNVDVSEL
ncbi:MAG TPA: hypothetical protein VI112_09225 [Bacteroidia bacterium]|jgi:hypothetical protein